MKKFLNLSMICLMAFSLCVMTSCKENGEENKKSDGIVTEGYVDMGLPSGNIWKATNEGDKFYTFEEAKKFGKQLPDTSDYMELVRECEWTWEGNGYKIVGKNGKGMRLPAAGMELCNGDVYNIGSDGYYWTSKTLGPQYAYRFGIYKTGMNINHNDRCIKGSVRLLK